MHRTSARGPKVYSQEIRDLVKQYRHEGLSSREITAKLKGLGHEVQDRQVRRFFNDIDDKERVQSIVASVLEDKVFEITLASVMQDLNKQNVWFQTQIDKIWLKLPDDEKHTAKFILKLFELKLKSSELLLKPLLLVTPPDQTTSQSDVLKGLEEKLGLLIEASPLKAFGSDDDSKSD